jgi:hypothetical protein
MEKKRPTERQHSRSGIVCKVEEKSGEVVLQVQVVLSGAEQRRRGGRVSIVLLTCGLLWATLGRLGMAPRLSGCSFWGGVVHPSAWTRPYFLLE